jgi:hypothetical protein
MNHPGQISIRTALRSFSGIILAIAILAGAPSLHGQESPIDDSQAGVLSGLDQSTTYPVQVQQAETSNQNRLNDNADTSRYTDNAFVNRPFYFSVESLGVWTSNLARSYDTVPAVGGEYVRLGVPVGLHLRSKRNDFNTFFRVDTSMYPGNSNLNHTSFIYSHQLVHQMSDITTSSWSLAGGHIVTLGQYLTPIIGVGSTGVVAPQQTSGLSAIDDAATTYTLAHQTSARDTLSLSGTVGWLDQPVLQTTGGPTTGAYREITGGAVAHWQRAINSREMAGVELSNVYVKGLNPRGESNFSAAKFTFSQTLTPHMSVSGGIGPLFVQSNVAGVTSQNSVSYAANAGVDYNRLFGHVSALYSRIYAVGYLSPSDIANEYFVSFDRPITPRFHLTSDTLYIRTALAQQQTNGAYSQVGFTTRLDMYLTRNIMYQIGGSIFNQDSTVQIPGYRYNNISGGLTYYFGHAPTAEREEQ